jgi:hypothetical protein
VSGNLQANGYKVVLNKIGTGGAQRNIAAAQTFQLLSG